VARVKENLKLWESSFMFVGSRVCAWSHIRCGPACISLRTGNRCDKERTNFPLQNELDSFSLILEAKLKICISNVILSAY
jgi:hypothetical protein